MAIISYEDLWGENNHLHEHECEIHGKWSCDGTYKCGKCPECEEKETLNE